MHSTPSTIINPQEPPNTTQVLRTDFVFSRQLRCRAAGAASKHGCCQRGISSEGVCPCRAAERGTWVVCAETSASLWIRSGEPALFSFLRSSSPQPRDIVPLVAMAVLRLGTGGLQFAYMALACLVCWPWIPTLLFCSAACFSPAIHEADQRFHGAQVGTSLGHVLLRRPS